jgi:hypothetical protein
VDTAAAKTEVDSYSLNSAGRLQSVQNGEGQLVLIIRFKARIR